MIAYGTQAYTQRIFIMKQEIRHRRLHAFYQSKVLNALMIVVCVSLTMMGYMHSIELPAVCALVAFVLFVGYSFWLWFKKPQKIVINGTLSNISGIYTLYFIAIALFPIESVNPWWYCLPAICAIVVMFICMIRPSDKVFEI